MPRPNHLASMCELSKEKNLTKRNTLNSVPVVEDGLNEKGLFYKC